jgi:hypothetical protein
MYGISLISKRSSVSSTVDPAIAIHSFFPPLGEAVVASVIEVCPDTKFSDFVGAGKVIDMMSVASSDETMAVDVISSALRREGRALVDHSL